ncbi:MAG TPA: rhodanese-like domain-containing protein [Saprospiraceae bacterium]|nr:rhodanese-like domain-containing protein [Saprospiraceae bacterium]
MKSNRSFIIALTALTFVISFSCKPSTKGDEVAKSDTAIVDDNLKSLDKQAFEEGFKKSGSVLIDVRQPQEFEQGHIEGAININFFDPEFKNKLLDLDRDKTYYLYDKTEARSYRSMKFMETNDFKNVFILKGGWKEWNTAHATDEKSN